MKILRRILDVILFLSERGLAFFGPSNPIPENGNFLGIIELLSKYDPLLSEHVEKGGKSQQSHKCLQVHYFSTRRQNEFINVAGSFVQTAIVNEIQLLSTFQ